MINKKNKKEHKEDWRFKTIYGQGNLVEGGPCISIFVDTVTGVNYLVTTSGGSGAIGTSITPLLDKDGKPVVSIIEL
jgi:hypothetical protein